MSIETPNTPNIPDPQDMPDLEDIPQELEQRINQPMEGFAFMASLVNEQMNDLELTLSEFAEVPVGKNSEMLSKVLSTHMETVHNTMKALCQESDQDELSQLRSALLYAVGLEQRRVQFLNTKLEFGEDTFDPANYDHVDLLCAGLEDEEEFDAADNAFWYYQNNLVSDMEKLSDYAVDAYGEKPSTRRKEIVTKLGGHALDVVKTGLAVFGAIVIAKRSKIL